MNDFLHFFQKLTSYDTPHPWQSELAALEACLNRLIRAPTGFGKTLGILATWLWHRLLRNDDRWPRRLIWCLPMRVLVEQTEDEVRKGLAALDMLWDGHGEHHGKVGVHLLMGGVDGGDWHLHPEQCAVLIGTQDMLLSRAMNRGYASPRARWPMEFGLLNHDALWVMDEVQLMDAGLATSGQLQAFRDEDAHAGKGRRPCLTWWMSATLQREWLTKSPETTPLARSMPLTTIPASGRVGHLWDDVSKPCQLEPIKNEKGLATLVAQKHLSAGRGANGPTLVVVNTVDRAVAVFESLMNNRGLQGTDLRLIHSRFRPAERVSWRADFLNRAACAPGTDRIIVATQVVEAGVDISAAVLITELAPWASLVQRFGRCARWGGKAQVVVADQNSKSTAPYEEGELNAARDALKNLTDVAPSHLEAFEEFHPEILPSLYPYAPRHLLLRHELNELFDTTPDLTGADIDISRFIRSGEERDLHVFWSDVPAKTAPEPTLRPTREALCTVPFLKARDWLCGKESSATKAPRLKPEMHAWVWDWLDGAWRGAERRDLFPGQTVLVASECGGYDYDIEAKAGRGWWPDSKEPVIPVVAQEIPPDELADAGQDDESLSAFPWQTITTHGRETGKLARYFADHLTPDLATLLDLAGRWHDAGKAHEAFQGSIKDGSGKPQGVLLAKAPKEAWLKGKQLYPIKNGEEHRPGFRHEIASALALFSVLQRHNPDHHALLGPWRELLQLAGMHAAPFAAVEMAPNPLEAEVLALDADHFNLLLYLVCAHHGKVRLAWHACPADQLAPDDSPRIRGLREGDIMPSLLLTAGDHSIHAVAPFQINLSPAAAGLNPRTGPGWTERILTVLEQHGPFALAWLEALLRAADQRASALKIPDELINPEVR